MPQRYIPLQRKLMRVIMLTCAVVLLLIFSALLVYEYFSYRDIARSELQATGEMIAANTSSSLAFADTDDAMQVLRSLEAQRNIQAAAIYNEEGKLFAYYGTGAVLPAIKSAPQAAAYEFRNFKLEGYQPVLQGDKRMGTLYLRSGLEDVYRRMALYAFIATLIIGVSALLAFGFSRRLQRSLARPILQLAEAAAQVTREQNYSLRAQRQNNDEVGQLTDAFNDMLARVEQKNAEILSLNQGLEEKVTERTRQLQESNASLQAQKEFTEAIIDASIDLIAVFDREGHYLAVNQQCVLHFQRSREEMLGHRFNEVFPSLGDSLFEQMFSQALNGETIREDAYQSRISGRWLQNFFIPILGSGGDVEQVLVIGHDITGIMETNAQLKTLNSDLEKSNRDLEQFAYIASHDLQEPLRKIQTFADLSIRNMQHPEILERYLDKIGAAASRMSNLIRDVLNYSRLARTDEEANGPVDLNEVLEAIRTDLELVIAEKDALIEAGPLPVVTGNALQLNQLFLNLLTNALKFTERQPRIAIRAQTVHSSEARASLRPGTYTELRFSDNGIGFEQEYADKIFAIFQRLHSGSEYLGTGIGLALCKKIVENHGGNMAVESRLGEGTTFYVYLPLQAAPATVTVADAQPGTALESE